MVFSQFWRPIWCYDDDIRGKAKTFMCHRHFFMCHRHFFYVPSAFFLGVDFINNFDITWSSKWLCPIIFSMWVMIWMTERSNICMCRVSNISMAGPHGFVKIMHLYLRTADIWICWFGRFAFVKPSRLHLQTSDIDASFGASLDFSQFVFVFSKSNHLHLQTGDIHICRSLLFSSLFINWNYDTYHIKYQRHSWLSFFTGSHIYALLLKSLPGDFFPHITHIEKMIEHNHFDDQVMSKLLMKSTPKKNAECT